MSILKVQGAQLYYEVRGVGPLLLLIPGARGEGLVFLPLAHVLSAHYKVVTYDRRGYSHSQLDGPQDYDRRLSTDAEDVRHLIEYLSDEPARLFGNSSGAIVALEVVSHYPNHVRMVVAHEPPAVKLLSEAAKWQTFFEEVYATYQGVGVHQALSNTKYWLEYELRQYLGVELDFTALGENASRIVLAGAHNSQDY